MKKSAAHRPSIDLARFVAAFGVVVAHAYVSPNDWVGHLSLGLFLILTAFLAVQSAQRAGGRVPDGPGGPLCCGAPCKMRLDYIHSRMFVK